MKKIPYIRKFNVSILIISVFIVGNANIMANIDIYFQSFDSRISNPDFNLKDFCNKYYDIKVEIENEKLKDSIIDELKTLEIIDTLDYEFNYATRMVLIMQTQEKNNKYDTLYVEGIMEQMFLNNYEIKFSKELLYILLNYIPKCLTGEIIYRLER